MSDSPENRLAESDSSENAQTTSAPENVAPEESPSNAADETAADDTASDDTASSEPPTDGETVAETGGEAADAGSRAEESAEAPESAAAGAEAEGEPDSQESDAAAGDAEAAAEVTEPAEGSAEGAEPDAGAEEPEVEAAGEPEGEAAAPEAVAAATESADESSAEPAATEEFEAADAEVETSVSAEAEAEAEVEAAAETEAPAEAAAEAPGEIAGAETGDAEAAAPAEAPAAEAAEAADVEAPAAEAADGEAPGDQSAAQVAAAAIEGLKAAGDPEMMVLREAMANSELIEGRIIGWNKGGYHVALGKLAAFCPVSQIEIGKPKNPKRYVDRTYRFHVTEIAPDGKRVVVSRASALKQERREQAERIKERLKPGTRHKGRVTSLTDFGAFVNLGDGAEGLVHVSEISRSRVEKPSEVLQAGQEVDVEVLKVEKGGQRISLSMKRLEPDPWKGVGERFPRGSKFKGKVVRQADFGLFVEVAPGLEGLVHLSRLALGSSLSDDELAEGKEIEGWVQEVEPKRKRLSLSLREVAESDPWKTVEQDFAPGSVVEGKVEKVAKFGVFVELTPGLTGLLPFSVVNLPTEANPRKKFPAGKSVRVTILDIDKKRKRVSLGTEGSQAEGTPADYRKYMKEQEHGSGFGALAAALQQARED